MEFKHRLHRLLAAEPELRASLRSDAEAVTYPPTDAVTLAWREGRRSIAAEWLSLYREVEDERDA